MNSNFSIHQLLVPKQQYDAIHSDSFFVITRMLAANEGHFATYPIIGFDPDGVVTTLYRSKKETPAMLVTGGYVN